MKTYVQTILPSGRALRLERLNSRQYKASLERVASKADPSNQATFGMKLAEELLLASFRGLTPGPVEVVTKVVQPADADSPALTDVDVDAMLDSVPEAGWMKPSYQDLVTQGPTELLELLSDPNDYTTALSLAQQFALGGGTSAFAGKTKLVSVES